MLRRSFLFAAALAAVSVLSSAAQAANIVVDTDSGTLGAFTLTNIGVSGSTTTLQLSFDNPSSEQTERINGVVTVVPMSWLSPITFDVTSLGGGLYSITSGVFTKTYLGDGNPAQNAMLSYTLSAGVVPISSFFNVTGTVVAVNQNPLGFGGNTYDFSKFVPNGAINLTLTGTNPPGATFGGVIGGGVGSFIQGSGSFSQIAIPEPTSMALLGIGLSGLLSFRRLVRRVTTA